MKRLRALFALLSFAIAADPAMALYPSKPIRLIVPFPAGGASDNAARIVSQGLTKSLGQPLIVENRPGGNGAVAAQAVLGAPPDGHTLLWGTGSMVALPLLQKDAPYKSMADLAPVALTGRFAYGLFVHPSVPAKSLNELIAYAKKQPDTLSYASGTLGEFMSTAEVLKASGITMVRVPYKGGAQAMPDLLAGRVQVYITPISLGLPHAKEGRLLLLATLLRERSAMAPDVPTLAEAGLPGVSIPPTWQAIFAAPQTPRDITEKLAREIGLVLHDPEVRAAFGKQAVHIEPSTPESLRALIAAEMRIWEQFVRENGIAPD